MGRRRPLDTELIGWTIAGAVAVTLFVVVCSWVSKHADAHCYGGKYGSCYYYLK